MAVVPMDSVLDMKDVVREAASLCSSARVIIQNPPLGATVSECAAVRALISEAELAVHTALVRAQEAYAKARSLHEKGVRP